MMAYVTLVLARNSASTIERTLNSILDQTPEPEYVCVVDDGSTDATREILDRLRREKQNRFLVVSRPDQGYDIRRVPANLNLAYAKLKVSSRDCDFLMISGDDCVYPREYVRRLISRMTPQRKIVVASGRPSTGGSVSQEHSPSGSGRIIRHSFWRAVGERYPMRVGWETWLLYRALEKGFEVRLYNDLTYEHLRPPGAMHQFAYWGAAMYALGYNPLYALGRIGKNLLRQQITLKGLVNMVEGYLLAFLGSSDPYVWPFEQSLRDFVHAQQSRRIVSAAGTLPKAFSLLKLKSTH
jgi:glycosyltransferase involved in cell wall biosynthesis